MTIVMAWDAERIAEVQRKFDEEFFQNRKIEQGDRDARETGQKA